MPGEPINFCSVLDYQEIKVARCILDADDNFLNERTHIVLANFLLYIVIISHVLFSFIRNNMIV